MKAQAFVGVVTKVEPHPESDKLDIVTISEKINIANRETPDQPRYKVGDCAVMLTENMLLPEWLLKRLDMWDETKNKGALAGKLGNRLKPRRMAGIMSEVALLPISWTQEDQPLQDYTVRRVKLSVDAEDVFEGATAMYVHVLKENTGDFIPVGMDVAGMLDIKEIYEPQA
jgi:tRNA-binding EMAP/Myf-like protein